MPDTRKECVYKAIEFRSPDRIPMCLDFQRDSLNDAIAKPIIDNYPSDILIASGIDPGFVPAKPGYTEWGYQWDTMGETMGEVKTCPIPQWEMYPEWESALPDFSVPRRFEAAEKLRAAEPDRFLVGGLGLGMEELINLRGFTEYMTDFYLEQENLESLIDLLYDKMLQLARGYAKAGMDAVIVWEDWGLQDRPLVGPDIWRKFFAGRMEKLVASVHDLGMKYILHSCGYILDFMDDFVRFGVDVIQLDQQANMGFEALSRWKGRICFFCPVDIQLSPSMGAAAIAQYAQKMEQALGTEQGGFLYKAYAQPAAIHMPTEGIRSEINAFGSIRLPASRRTAL